MSLTYEVGSITSGEVPAATQGQASYISGYSCDGEQLVSASNRSYAIWTLLEGGAVYCIDNI